MARRSFCVHAWRRWSPTLKKRATNRPLARAAPTVAPPWGRDDVLGMQVKDKPLKVAQMSSDRRSPGAGVPCFFRHFPSLVLEPILLDRLRKESHHDSI